MMYVTAEKRAGLQRKVPHSRIESLISWRGQRDSNDWRVPKFMIRRI